MNMPFRKDGWSNLGLGTRLYQGLTLVSPFGGKKIGLQPLWSGAR